MKQPQPQGRPPQLIPTSMEVTNAQIGNVLIVMNNLFPFLAASRSDDGMEKNVATSAEGTFVRACNVLDSILDDENRWKTDTVDAMAKVLEQLYATQAELNANSAAALAQANRPSFLLKPSLVERKPGEWVAQYGSGRNALKGVGPTPYQAMLAFDMAYFNLTKIQQQPPNEQ